MGPPPLLVQVDDDEGEEKAAVEEAWVPAVPDGGETPSMPAPALPSATSPGTTLGARAEEVDSDETNQRKRRRRRRRSKRGDGVEGGAESLAETNGTREESDEEGTDQTRVAEDGGAEGEAGAGGEVDESARKSRRRGRRGGRRRRRGGEESDVSPDAAPESAIGEVDEDQPRETDVSVSADHAESPKRRRAVRRPRSAIETAKPETTHGTAEPSERDEKKETDLPQVEVPQRNGWWKKLLP